MGATTLPETVISGRRVRKQPIRLSASPPKQAITASCPAPQQLCAEIMAWRAESADSDSCCAFYGSICDFQTSESRPSHIFVPVVEAGAAA
jgi:hypothetical protein